MSVATSFRRGEARQESGRPELGRSGRAAAVPYLRLVKSGETVSFEEMVPPEEPAPPIPAQRVATAMTPAQRTVEDRHRPVRLTRRGRAVLWLLLLGVAITVMALIAPASQAASPAGPPRTVTVHAGDTMWSIATGALPHAAPNTAMERIRVLNHLPDNEVYAGEQLLVPAG